MAAPVIGTRPRYAPSIGSTVDASHPLAQGLEFCWVPSVSNNDLSHGYRSTVSGTPSLGSMSYGLGRSFTGTSDGYAFSGLSDTPFVGALSILAVGKLSENTATEKLIVEKGANPFRLYWYIDVLTFWRSNTNGTTFRAFQGGFNGNAVINREYILVVTVANGTITTQPICYYNGAVSALSSNQGTGTGLAGTSSADLAVGYRPGSTSATMKGGLNEVAVWSRALSSVEAAALYADPFCFLKV